MSQPNKPAAHTPGPWLIDGDDEPMPGVPAIEISTETGPGWKLVAYVMCDGETNRLADVDRANARLIAAAPELLRECKREVGWLEHIRPQISAPTSVLLGFDQALKYLRDAIARAEAV